MPSVGADEAGYGPVAGPLVVVAARASDPASVSGIDSKLLRGDHRRLMAMIVAAGDAVAYRVEIVPADEVDRAPGPARRRGFRDAVTSIAVAGDGIIVDGNLDFGIIGAIARPKADRDDPIVGLASCRAKVAQLDAMVAIHAAHPAYGFDAHAGYATPRHIAALVELGAIPGVHRLRIVRRMLESRGHRFRIATVGHLADPRTAT